MKKMWIVTYVDHNCNSNGKADVVGVYFSKEEAKAAVKTNIEYWRTNNQDEGVEVDFYNMVGWFDYDPNDRCEWNISECDIALTITRCSMNN